MTRSPRRWQRRSPFITQTTRRSSSLKIVPVVDFLVVGTLRSLAVRICSAGRVHAGLDRVWIGVCVQSGDHGTPNALASSTDCEHVRPGDRALYRRGELYRVVWTVDGPASSNADEENAPVRSKPQHTLWNSTGRSFHPTGGLRIKAPHNNPMSILHSLLNVTRQAFGMIGQVIGVTTEFVLVMVLVPI